MENIKVLSSLYNKKKKEMNSDLVSHLRLALNIAVAGYICKKFYIYEFNIK